MDTLVQLGDFLFGFGVFLAGIAGLWWVTLYDKKKNR